MAQFLGFGNGSDGVLTISSNTTEAPIDASCSGTSGATSLSATNVSFAADQIILIHQTRGTGVGNWELNQIASYSAGTITTRFALSNTYTDSGDSQAQVRVVKQYSSVTINTAVTYSPKAWDENVGGILAFMCSGKTSIVGTLSGSGKGFLGRTQLVGDAAPGKQGEGTSGAGTKSASANGNGGGGGPSATDAAAGGGHAAAGTDGEAGATGGSSAGSSDLTTMVFGGAGGSTPPNGSNNGATGGSGGAQIIIFTQDFEVTGTLPCDGNGGNGGAGGGSPVAGSGGGAGGSVLVRCVTASIGTNLITALGGAGGSNPSVGDGGAGSVGRIRIESCSLTGTTNPTASTQTGGYDFCAALGSIL